MRFALLRGGRGNPTAVSHAARPRHRDDPSRCYFLTRPTRDRIEVRHLASTGLHVAGEDEFAVFVAGWQSPGRLVRVGRRWHVAAGVFECRADAVVELMLRELVFDNEAEIPRERAAVWVEQGWMPGRSESVLFIALCSHAAYSGGESCWWCESTDLVRRKHTRRWHR